MQDMALRRMNLPVELHASTQAATRTPEQALFLERCGFARVILERALSLDEIRTIRAACGVDLECFVHGAICVGYSGRCFLSRSMSERSGNRGACSQPCRLTYDLVDESGRTVVKGRHLLSVRDLNLSDRIGELIDAGITSFKIEGRLKDIGYIKNVVSYYRQRIDRALASRPGFCRSSVERAGRTFSRILRRVSRGASRSISSTVAGRESHRSTRPKLSANRWGALCGSIEGVLRSPGRVIWLPVTASVC